MDFVEEENLFLTYVREDGCEIPLDLQHGAGGLLIFRRHLIGNDGRECRLA